MLPSTHTGKVWPGYEQQVVPTPQAPQGQVLQPGAVKYCWQLPCTHSSSDAQTCPHCPQFMGSVASCASVRHTPLQEVRPIAMHVVSAHAPSTHLGFWNPWFPQLVPQAPQLVKLCCSSTQVLPHRVNPGRQWQVPASQKRVALHWVLQLPQRSGSCWVSAQVCPHTVPPAGHWHTPALHTSPNAQWMLHVPQNCGSVCRSTQALPHEVSGGGQEHCPDVHTCPSPQT